MLHIPVSVSHARRRESFASAHPLFDSNEAEAEAEAEAEVEANRV